MVMIMSVAGFLRLFLRVTVIVVSFFFVGVIMGVPRTAFADGQRLHAGGFGKLDESPAVDRLGAADLGEFCFKPMADDEDEISLAEAGDLARRERRAMLGHRA
jgi:hypothetical protein